MLKFFLTENSPLAECLEVDMVKCVGENPDAVCVECLMLKLVIEE